MVFIFQILRETQNITERAQVKVSESRPVRSSVRVPILFQS